MKLIFCGSSIAVLMVCLPGLRADSDVKVPAAADILSAEQWRQDLAAMKEGMTRTHKDLYHTVSRQTLDAAFQQLSADLPSLNHDQIIVRLMQITALVRDGHSGVDIVFRPGPTHVALRISRSADGLFIRSAPAESSQAVGARIVAVGGVPWKDVLERLDTIIACDPGNDGERRGWQPELLLTDPLVLHGLGLAASANAVTYLLENGGRQFALNLQPSINATDLWTFGAPPSWVDARREPGIQPIEHPWIHPLELAYVPSAKAIYWQFNKVESPVGESMDVFAERLLHLEQTTDAQRLVIDLRHNPGGDNTLLRPLLIGTIRSRFNHRGGLFVLTGPSTFSAAQNFVNRIESYTDAIFVGEPTSQNVNFFGDPRGTELPNSHLGVFMAHYWWQDKNPWDRRTATTPEIAISPGSFTDYESGHDAALEYCLQAPVPAAFEDMMQTSAKQGRDRALEQYEAYTKDPMHRYSDDLEGRLNTRAYKLLEEKDVSTALILLQVNAQLHPKSANAYDSLGDGFEACGDTKNAILAFHHSVELNPQNEHAKEAEKRLSQPPR